MIRALALLLALLTAPALCAEERVVLGLSQSEVAITTTFDGSDLLIFGAVKRETAIPEGPPLEVIITISGPRSPVTLRRKERRAGIWVNTTSERISLAPTFYAVATSAPLGEALRRIEDLKYRISIPRAIFALDSGVGDTAAFTEALIRLRTENGSYQMLQNAVAVDEQTLFRTRVALPANLTEGMYTARIFLTREGRVIELHQTRIPVQKVGLERWLYQLAQERAALYGLLSLSIAIAAGWLASAAFRLIRP